MRKTQDYTNDIATGLINQFAFLNEVRNLGLLRSNDTVVLDDGEKYGGINDTIAPAGYIRYAGANTMVTYDASASPYTPQSVASKATVLLRLVLLHQCENDAELEMSVASYLNRHLFNADNLPYKPAVQVNATDRDPERIFDAEVRQTAQNMNARYKLLAVDFTLTMLVAWDECETYTCDGC